MVSDSAQLAVHSTSNLRGGPSRWSHWEQIARSRALVWQICISHSNQTLGCFTVQNPRSSGTYTFAHLHQPSLLGCFAVGRRLNQSPVLDRTNTYPHVNPKFPLELCDWMRCKRKGPYLSENMGFLSLIDDVEQDCLTFKLLASIYKPNYFQKLAEVQKIFN